MLLQGATRFNKEDDLAEGNRIHLGATPNNKAVMADLMPELRTGGDS